MDDAPFYVESRWSGSEAAPSVERMHELISELNERDEEHPDTWLIHSSSGWGLTLDENGYAHLSDADCKIVAHMQNVSADQALQLWIRFSTQGPQGVNAEAWTKGPRYISPEEIALRQARADASSCGTTGSFTTSLAPNTRPSRANLPAVQEGMSSTAFCVASTTSSKFVTEHVRSIIDSA